MPVLDFSAMPEAKMGIESATALQESTFSLLEASTTRLTAKQKLAAIDAALAASDVARLRELARAPGGLGGRDARRWRREVWPLLLGVQKQVNPKGKEKATGEDAPSSSRWEDLPPHPDEHQVALDVGRSFVSYPSNISEGQKMRLRDLLNALIIATLRKHPSLSYFQGYHDIVSVLLLSLIDFKHLPSDEEEPGSHNGVSEEDVAVLEQCVERLSLHRIRDSMGKTMEPVMGYLRILQAILSLSSPTLGRLLSPHASSLPLFSLSWILTLTAHDLPTLPVVSRLFDFLLAEDPVMVSYVGAAICELKKVEVEQMLREWGVDVDAFVKEGGELEDGVVDEAMVHHVMAKLPAFRIDEGEEEVGEGETDKASSSDEATEGRARASSVASSSDFETITTSPTPDSHERQEASSASHVTEHDDDTLASSVATLVESKEDLEDSFHYTSDVDTPAFASTPPPSPPRPKPPVKPKVKKLENVVSVEALIATTLSLHSRFPPWHAELGIEEIMGPKSCVFTWPALSVSGTLDDDTAEAIVRGPVGDIVRPDPRALREEEERKKREERLKRRRAKRAARTGEWEVTPAKVIVAAGVAGLVVALWTSEQVRSWVVASGRSWRHSFSN